MAIVGTIALWGLAIVGLLSIVGGIYCAIQDAKLDYKDQLDEPRPPLQIANLRNLPQPEQQPAPGPPQILQKTTMQITTTKYTDPTAAAKKELSA